MAYIDRVRRQFASQLQPGETIEFAVRGARTGWAAHMAVGAVVGFVLGYFVAGFVGYRPLTTTIVVGLGLMVGIIVWTLRVSDESFTAFFALAVTSRRLLVLERDEVWGRTKRVMGSYEFGDVQIEGTGSGRLGGTLDVTIDGSTHRLRFPPGQRVRDLVATLSR
ncbi:MAG: hypothetical protein HKN93_04000 [Acidimicrobiia bacterium]|nr:hypothetical protein [Acidimicrobiia bacterium]